MMKIALFPGDGIGPEVTAQAVRVLEALRSSDFVFEVSEAPVGGAALTLSGHPLPEASIQLALVSDAVLFGAVGDPRFDHLARALRPEQAILGLRRALGLYACVRHITIDPALAEISPLRSARSTGTDLLIVRELNGDVYNGQPRGQRRAPDGDFEGGREGFDTMRYADGEVRRIAHVAFKAARSRSGRVCSVDKANVLETSQLWRTVFKEVALDYPDVALTHMYADNAVVQLIARPAAFDVIATGNLFGDILCDAASVLTGSVGLPASALLGAGSHGMYEAGHGTALDIAGRNVANPIGCIRAAALMLRHSGQRPDLANRIESAIQTVLEKGYRTADIANIADTSDTTTILVGTQQMGEAIAQAVHDTQP